MSKISRRPIRNAFRKECLAKQLEEGKTTQEHVDEMTDLYLSWDQQKFQREQDPEWQKNNMEYDLRTTDWILAKARASEVYAQNLYAAMCNQDFQQNAVWPQLKNQTWSCSWRYAGGIVADMRGEGDYIDWYCSGIRDTDSEPNGFVGEGVVTDEIRADLFRLGWLVVDNEDMNSL